MNLTDCVPAIVNDDLKTWLGYTLGAYMPLNQPKLPRDLYLQVIECVQLGMDPLLLKSAVVAHGRVVIDHIESQLAKRKEAREALATGSSTDPVPPMYVHSEIPTVQDLIE